MSSYWIRKTLEHITPQVEDILVALGSVMVVDKDQIPRPLWPDNPPIPVLLHWNNLWGQVTYAFTAQEHLVLIANMGDKGEVAFCLTAEGDIVTDLPEDIRERIDRNSVGYHFLINVTKPDGIVIGAIIPC